MSTKTGLLIVACLIVFIIIRVNIAMNYQDRPENSQSDAIELPTAFTGTLPCADCPDIDYEIRLEEGQATEFSRYQERSPQHVSKTGIWDISGDTLVVHPDDPENQKIFRVTENSLLLLYKHGEEIPSDVAENHRLQRNTEFQSILDRHLELRNEGVKFVGTGNEPFWNFNVLEGDTLVYTTPEMELKSRSLDIQQHESGANYFAEFGSDQSIEINVQRQFCQDTMSGFMFTHAVTVTKDGMVNTGCGRYL